MPECAGINVITTTTTETVIDLAHVFLSPGAINYDGSALAPGTVICLNTGVYSRLTFRNLVGTALAPITIRNCGGLVTMTDIVNENYLIDCQHVRLTGSGAADIPYGIKYQRRLLAQEGCSDIELDHLEFDGVQLNVRNDDDIVMQNIHIHHNYIYDQAGSAMYIGHSGWDGTKTMQHLYVYANRIINCKEGIQCTRCTSDLQIYDNYLENINPVDPGTIAAVTIREGCTSRIYRNEIRDCQGNGVRIHETVFNDHEVYNNLVYYTGHTPSIPALADGMRINTENALIYNNTIVTVGDGSDGWGIWFPDASSNCFGYNNVILDLTDGSIREGGNDPGNFYNNDTEEEGYTPANYGFVNQPIDFRLATGCDGIDAGTNVGAPSDDLDKKSRPVDGTTDIGCYEYGCPA